MLYVPEGCAQGYLTLVEDSERVVYLTSAPCARPLAAFATMIRPFAIEWPTEPRVVSQADRSWPDSDDQAMRSGDRSR